MLDFLASSEFLVPALAAFFGASLPITVRALQERIHLSKYKDAQMVSLQSLQTQLGELQKRIIENQSVIIKLLNDKAAAAIALVEEVKTEQVDKKI